MTGPIVSVEIGRSTWQGPAEEAPRRAGNRDADERYGRAAGQQVRALVANLSVWAGKAHPDQQLVDLAHVLAILDSNPAALMPAPQPEGQSHRSFPDAADGRPMPPMGEDLMAAGLSGEDARFVALQLAQNGLMLVPATPTAQEAVAWRCKDYADGWILYGNKAQAELYQACTGCLMEALYAHPPQPSETVAEALSGLMEAYKEIADSGDAGFWKAEETPEYQAAVAALRALKGGAHG